MIKSIKIIRLSIPYGEAANRSKDPTKLRTASNPCGLGRALDPAKLLLHRVDLAQLFRDGPVRAQDRDIVRDIVLVAQATLDDATHGELVQAPGEIDERDEQQQRPDGAAGGSCCRWKAWMAVPRARRAAPLMRHGSGIAGSERRGLHPLLVGGRVGERVGERCEMD